MPPRPATRPKRHLLKRTLLTLLALLAIFGCAGIALLWWDHDVPVELPDPTGPYQVGRTSYVWRNDAATMQLPPNPDKPRSVAAWVWYPAAESTSAQEAEYLPKPWRDALAESSGFVMTELLTRDLALVKDHSKQDPPFAEGLTSVPVVVMRPGGTTLTMDLTTLAEDLASHGYVVVGFDAPYRSVVTVLSDGRVVPRSSAASLEETADASAQAEKLLPLWTDDARFVVDQLAQLNEDDPSGRFQGRLDLERVGAFGHSFGGATALEFCLEDDRCQAGIDIDGIPFGQVLKEGLSKPVAFLLSDHGDLTRGEASQVIPLMKSIYDRLPEGRQFLYVPRTNHFSFTDQMLLKSSPVIGLIELLQQGPDKRRGLAIAAAFVHTFFDVYLKSASPSALDTVRMEFPELKGMPQ